MPRHLAGFTLYLHRLPTAFQHRKSLQLNAPFVFLAVAYLYTIYRIFSRSYAGIFWSFVRPNWRSYQPFSGYFVPHFRAFANIYWNSWFRRFGTREYSTNSTTDQVNLNISHQDYYSLTSCSSNYRQRSLYGFRMSTLIGWVGGDSFKCVYAVHSTFFYLHSDVWNQGGIFLPTRISASVQSLFHLSDFHWHQ